MHPELSLTAAPDILPGGISHALVAQAASRAIRR